MRRDCFYLWIKVMQQLRFYHPLHSIENGELLIFVFLLEETMFSLGGFGSIKYPREGPMMYGERR